MPSLLQKLLWSHLALEYMTSKPDSKLERGAKDSKVDTVMGSRRLLTTKVCAAGCLTKPPGTSVLFSGVLVKR